MFPTTARGATSRLIVAFRRSENGFGRSHGLEVVRKIGEALEEGIRAKTSLGFGKVKILQLSQ